MKNLPKKVPNRPSMACHHGPTNTYILESPLGSMKLKSCPKGIHSLGMFGDLTKDTFKPDLSQRVTVQSQLYDDNGYTYKPAVQCVEWLIHYFSPQSASNPPPAVAVCPSIYKEGSFTALVWETLPESVGFGKTITYGGLAELCQNAKASRAVGQAMANNPLQLVIPCHRVLCSTGALGNYAHGERNYVKRWLLEYEGSHVR